MDVIYDIYLMTITSILSNYWEKYCYTVPTSSCLSCSLTYISCYTCITISLLMLLLLSLSSYPS